MAPRDEDATVEPAPRLFAHKQSYMQIRRSVPLILLVWLFSVPAVLPLLQPTIPRSADGLLHLYRVVALADAVQQGELFPRWLPDLAFGYGFPLFVYYAPLAYYATLFFTFTALNNISAALNASFMLASFAAGTGMYLFAKAALTPKAGLLAAIAYVYAPFQLYNTLFRGSLPAAWAMAIFPVVFWVFCRLSKQPDGAHFLSALIPLGSIILGAALLSHNTLSLLFIPMLALYLLIVIVGQALTRPKLVLRLLGQYILILTLGTGLAAFFLIPAVMERDFAQVERVITSPDFDFRFHFVTLAELLSWPSAANTGQLNPSVPLTLGLVHVGLALAGLLSATVRCLKLRQQLANEAAAAEFCTLLTIVVFSTVTVAIAMLMMQPLSQLVWEWLPLLAFVQFPHRLLGPAALAMALAVGLVIAATKERWYLGLTIVTACALFVAAVPLLYPRYISDLAAHPSITDMMTYERHIGAIGTTSFGEYLPIWVKHVPAESPLEPMYRRGDVIERLDQAYLPPDTGITSATYGFNQADIEMNLPEAGQAVFHTFYFPGWQAYVDGQPARVGPVTERGLIGLVLPAGRHRLQLIFTETPLRRLANILSITTGLVTLGLIGIISIRSHNSHISTATIDSAWQPQRNQFWVLAAVAITLVGLKLLYFDRFDTPLKHTFADNAVYGVQNSTKVNFGNTVTLLGYTVAQSTVEAGQPFDITVYWQAQQPLTVNFSALTHLVDEAGNLYGGHDSLHPGTIPSSQWLPWGFVADRHALRVPYGTPPGDYLLVTGLYDPVSWARLPVLSGGSPGWADVLPIPVQVVAPDRIATLAELDIEWPLTVDFGSELRLLGATPEREAVKTNDFLRIALFWEALQPPQQDYTINLRLLGPDGTVLQKAGGQPSFGRYPSRQWRAGERVRDNHALWIPPDFPLESGIYRLQLQVLDGQQQALADWLEIGQLGKETINH